MIVNIMKNGCKICLNEGMGRENEYGPAFLKVNPKFKSYWVNGKTSNLNGPAVIHEHYGKFYYIDGVSFDLKEYIEYIELKKRKNDNPYNDIRKPTAPPSEVFGGTKKQNRKRERKKIKNEIKNGFWK